MKKEIKKSMTFKEILKKYPDADKLLMGKGMHCIGCPMAQQETLEQGAIMHGLDPDKLIKEMNTKLKNKE